MQQCSPMRDAPAGRQDRRSDSDILDRRCQARIFAEAPLIKPSRSASTPSIDRVRRAGGLRKSLASVRSSPPPWSPRSVIGKCFRPGEAWQPGSVLFPSSIRRAARNDSAGSQSREIDFCDGCSAVAARLPPHWPWAAAIASSSAAFTPLARRTSTGITTGRAQNCTACIRSN